MRILMSLTAMMASLLTAAPTLAIDGGPAKTPPGDPPTPAIVATAGVQFGRPPAGHGKSDGASCSWHPAGAFNTTESGHPDDKVVAGVTYRLFLRVCPSGSVLLWVGSYSTLALAASAAMEVTKLLAKPAVMTAPPADKGIVKIGMWFWTDPAQYQSHSVTAWVPTPTGIVWSTTTARPVRLEYEPGEPDGATAACAGPGDAWQPADGDETPSACMYTYQHSSEITDTDTFPARMTIVWEISWTSNSGAGTLPVQRTTTRQDVAVGEIQAIVTG